MHDLVSYLFQTNAIKICPENKPFWYTSGKIGPYFINTHFIYGSEEDANNLLAFIDEHKEDKFGLPKKVLDATLKQYEENTIYKDVIDQMKEFITKYINLSEIDYISGGERRDWFFSNILAYLLDKPHITIYKDLSTVVSDSNFESNEDIKDLNGKKVLHIADLITVASSYVRAWIPAIESLGAKILWSTVVVDRMQGGEESLREYGITSLAMVRIDLDLFSKASELGIISEAQQKMLNDFFKDPDNSMREFLLQHPEFLENSLNGDEKTASRARLCVEGNLYNL
jgi:orotate phosphoribosyltransferase